MYQLLSPTSGMKFVLSGILILLASISFQNTSLAQASVPTDTQDMVLNQVHQELDAWQKSESFADILAAHPGSSGNLTLEISIYNKGRVRSIFQVDSNIEDVPLRNTIKNHIKEHKFDLKKMDKKTTQKVRYTFHINE